MRWPDVLFGAVSPSGKLPTTFPKRLQDNPTYINYPGENGKVYYGEGCLSGIATMIRRTWRHCSRLGMVCRIRGFRIVIYV